MRHTCLSFPSSQILKKTVSCTPTGLLVAPDIPSALTFCLLSLYFFFFLGRTTFIFGFLAVSRCGKRRGLKKKTQVRKKRHVASIISSLTASATWWLDLALKKCCYISLFIVLHFFFVLTFVLPHTESFSRNGSSRWFPLLPGSNSSPLHPCSLQQAEDCRDDWCMVERDHGEAYGYLLCAYPSIYNS